MLFLSIECQTSCNCTIQIGRLMDMADRLLLNLEVPPSLIFACFPRRPRRRLWGSYGGIRIAVPEFRLSSRLPPTPANLALPPHSSSSSSTSSPPNSAPAKLDLVSRTQLSDGSHVFRFGDASEVERNLGTEEKLNRVGVQEQQAEISEEDSGVWMEQGVQSGHITDGFDGPSESGVLNDKSNEKREGTSAVTVTVNPDVETALQEKDGVASTNSRNVIKIKDRKRARSPRKRKKETLNPANVSKHDDGVETKHSGDSNLNSEESGITAESSSLELCSQTSDHPQVTEKAIESETRAKSSSLNPSSESHDYREASTNNIGRETRSESSSSELSSKTQDPQEVTQEKIDINFIQVSFAGHGDSLDASGNSMINVDAEGKPFVEPTTTATMPHSESMSIAAHSAEPCVSDGTDVGKGYEYGENEASTAKEEITAADTKSEVIQISAPSVTELLSIETASGRDGVATRGFLLDAGVAALQHPSKALAGREDAYFIAHQTWLGVADGVSQWSFEGINPGTYAQELLSNCQKIVSDRESVWISDPVEVLSRSASETKSPGSSTVLLAYFDDQALHAVNIGDSGFMVIRNGKVLRKSSPMVLQFGFPLQIVQGDDPSKLGEVYHVDLDEGDVIITATDGLFDNLYETEIASFISRSLQQNLELKKIAELLATKAQEVGHSASARTPFADEAQAAGYTGCRGGKLDAVTVVVSLVKTPWLPSLSQFSLHM